MKKTTFTLALAILISLTTSAQSQQAFKYQAVVRNNIGNLIQNQLVAFRISVLQGVLPGTTVYQERHTGSTNNYGLANLEIGNGVVLSGVFSDINWTHGSIFLKIEFDPAGGTSYQDMGTSQLLPVPYALHTQTSEKFSNITTEQRDLMTNVNAGVSFYNTSTNRINYFDGVHWHELNSTCLPAATPSNAGPDQFNIIGASATLQANTATSGTGAWQILFGTGGFLENVNNPLSIFNGIAGSSYTLRWVISNDCGANADDVVISFAPFSCGSTFMDIRDGKVYNSVMIGSQCWMAENLNVGTKIDGNVNMQNNGVIEKYCNSNLESNCNIYGGMYQWAEAMQYVTTSGAQGICASGWHLPSDSEWKILEGTVDSQYGVGDPIWDIIGDRGLDAGGKLKETGTTHWVWPNTGATNSSGFTALPGGSRNTDGTYPGFQIYGRYWTSNESGTNAYRRVFSTARADIARDASSKNFGLSLRCVKD